jgi:ketosteroid isomerase-like protein
MQSSARAVIRGRDTAWAMVGREAAMIDALRRTFEAFNRGDFDAAVASAHPEIEFAPPGGQASLRGAEALRAWMEPDAFEEQRIEPLDFWVQGNKVLVRQHTQARGAGSGIELDIEIWTVFTFDDDLLATRMESYLPHQESEALAAAGLAE